jgi:hypothetical protein
MIASIGIKKGDKVRLAYPERAEQELLEAYRRSFGPCFLLLNPQARESFLREVDCVYAPNTRKNLICLDVCDGRETGSGRGITMSAGRRVWKAHSEGFIVDVPHVAISAFVRRA